MPEETASRKPDPIAPVFVLTEIIALGCCATTDVAHWMTFWGSKFGSHVMTVQWKSLAICRAEATTPMLSEEVPDSSMTAIVLPFGGATFLPAWLSAAVRAAAVCAAVPAYT